MVIAMDKHAQVKQIIEELLRRLGVSFETVEITEDSGRVAFVVKSEDSSILIGTHGVNISALNHLVKRIVGKRLNVSPDTPFNFYVDINDYHEKLVREIKNKATILAERARSFKVDVEMDPMSPYERMVIHTFFEEVPDIKTESRGTGSKRRVVLKYIGDDI